MPTEVHQQQTTVMLDEESIQKNHQTGPGAAAVYQQDIDFVSDGGKSFENEDYLRRLEK